MKVEAKYVSPQMAEELLATTEHNRSVSHNRVLTFANLMRTKRWQMNGETIIVSETGKLLDGQHRMFAVIEYGASVQMLIATGAPDNSFETIDTGRARTAGDILGMEGINNPNVVAAAAGMLWRLFHRTAINEPCPAQTVLEVVERFPVIHKWATYTSAYKGARAPLPPGSFLTAQLYLEGVAMKPRLAEQFFDGITKGVDLGEGSPILALRNRMMNLRASGGILNATTCWAPTARALSALEASETLTRLSVEMAHGSIRHPALWHDHVEALPKEQRIDLLWTSIPREQGGGSPAKKFKGRVAEIRGSAKKAG